MPPEERPTVVVAVPEALSKGFAVGAPVEADPAAAEGIPVIGPRKPVGAPGGAFDKNSTPY